MCIYIHNNIIYIHRSWVISLKRRWISTVGSCVLCLICAEACNQTWHWEIPWPRVITGGLQQKPLVALDCKNGPRVLNIRGSNSINWSIIIYNHYPWMVISGDTLLSDTAKYNNDGYTYIYIYPITCPYEYPDNIRIKWLILPPVLVHEWCLYPPLSNKRHYGWLQITFVLVKSIVFWRSSPHIKNRWYVYPIFRRTQISNY